MSSDKIKDAMVPTQKQCNGQARCSPLSRWHWRDYTRSPSWMKGLHTSDKDADTIRQRSPRNGRSTIRWKTLPTSTRTLPPRLRKFHQQGTFVQPLSPAWNIGCPQLQVLLGTRTALTGRPRGGGWQWHRRKGINIIMHPEPESASQTTPKQPGYYSHYNIKLTWILDISTENYAAQLSLNLASRACSWKSIEQSQHYSDWEKISKTLNSQMTPYISSPWVSYGISIVMIFTHDLIITVRFSSSPIIKFCL